MQTMDFIDTFIELFIATASLLIIFLISSILFMMQKVDKGLFKAKLFLNTNVMEQTWTYISIAGASFAINALILFFSKFVTAIEILNSYYFVEINQAIFLIAFILAIWKWYEFIDGFEKHKQSIHY